MPLRRIGESNREQGFLASEYHSSPFPFYHLKFLEVDPNFQGAGAGTELVDNFTDFLKRNKAVGILYNAAENRGAHIYESAGWREIKSHPGWFEFNLPEDTSSEDLNEAITILEIT